MSEKNEKLEDRLKPVSYTHLDVYKRQVITGFNFNSGSIFFYFFLFETWGICYCAILFLFYSLSYLKSYLLHHLNEETPLPSICVRDTRVLLYDPLKHSSQEPRRTEPRLHHSEDPWTPWRQPGTSLTAPHPRPVSYTHLDVYKRQVGHRSTCHPNQPKNALDKTTSSGSQIILQYLIMGTLANARRAQEYVPPQACLLYTSRCV